MIKHTDGPWTIKTMDIFDGHKNNKHFEIVSESASEWIVQGKIETEQDMSNLNLIASAPELLKALQQALRFIEVSEAYKGAMTAEQVESAIAKNQNTAQTEIAANSCTTLATFNFNAARAAIAKAKGEQL
jgi:hypothetical protein